MAKDVLVPNTSPDTNNPSLSVNYDTNSIFDLNTEEILNLKSPLGSDFLMNGTESFEELLRDLLLPFNNNNETEVNNIGNSNSMISDSELNTNNNNNLANINTNDIQGLKETEIEFPHDSISINSSGSPELISISSQFNHDIPDNNIDFTNVLNSTTFPSLDLSMVDLNTDLFSLVENSNNNNNNTDSNTTTNTSDYSFGMTTIPFASKQASLMMNSQNDVSVSPIEIMGGKSNDALPLEDTPSQYQYPNGFGRKSENPSFTNFFFFQIVDNLFVYVKF